MSPKFLKKRYMHNFILLLLFICFSAFNTKQINASKPDVTLIGSMKFSDGLFRISIGLIDALSQELKISFVPSGLVDLTEVPEKVKKVVACKSTMPGTVALLLDSPWHVWDTPAKYVPNCAIKLAYSMLEGTEIPPAWVSIFNKQFDAVIVPDKFLVAVYQKSGVKIPLFVIPLGLYIDHLLENPIKQAVHTPFVFGSSAFFSPGKNHEIVIKAFAQEFGNNPDVLLKLHGRYGETNQLYQLIEELKVTNVEIIQKSLSAQEYRDFMQSLDCYVLLSLGEGFSSTPREALALGIPCIVSDNTAHKTLTKTGLVYAVPSNIPVPAYYFPLGGTYGHKFACTQSDAAQALCAVYKDYSVYLHKAHIGRAWVKKYTYDNIKHLYATLFKPKKIRLGKSNTVKPGCIITTSRTLFKKYKRTFKL